MKKKIIGSLVLTAISSMMIFGMASAQEAEVGICVVGADSPCNGPQYGGHSPNLPVSLIDHLNWVELFLDLHSFPSISPVNLDDQILDHLDDLVDTIDLVQM